MENFGHYTRDNVSNGPLSDIAQRIMSAMQKIPLEGRQHNRPCNSHRCSNENIINHCKPFINNSNNVKPRKELTYKESLFNSISLPSEYMNPFTNCQGLVLHKCESEKQCSSTPKEKNGGESGKELVLKRKLDHWLHMKEKMLLLKEDANISEDKCGSYSVVQGLSQLEVSDCRYLGSEEKVQLLEKIKQATALIITMIFQDGSSQLSISKGIDSSVKGIAVLMKQEFESFHPCICSAPLIRDTSAKDSRCIYIQIEHTSVWSEKEESYKFARDMLLQIICCKGHVICFNAKDFLKTILQIYGKHISWKQVADFVVLDPRIAAWLIDPSDTMPLFEDLAAKYCEKFAQVKRINTNEDSFKNVLYPNVYANLEILFCLMKDLHVKLQVQGLWPLFFTLELPLITILAVMETHKICVNEDELKKTSELLALQLKKLEQEAHNAAGEKFHLTSSKELREVLFEKLHLHHLCNSKKLPKTGLQQLQSTSEAVLHQLQDFHPLPKIILEYRQVHKMKSAFVDGLMSCMKKGFVSSIWNQTGTVSGRLSSRRPNIQGIPKQSIDIVKQQCVQGKEKETLNISPRTMFVSGKDCTFLAADFSQVELRILAHFSCDPELLKLFKGPETTDVFTALASQWKGIPLEQVKHVHREQAKRVVYSVIYGAGKERLAQCLGISPVQASQFIESFQEKYKKVRDFTQKTIQQCQNKGYVTSIMGRRRPLPQINAKNYTLRSQAERQAVNFVIQGSAADLCKLAMIKIFSSIAASSFTARLIAQIHDELLFEVEDSQIKEFSALVKHTMESVQQVEVMGIEMKVPLKVILSTGKSWGSMVELW